MLTSENLLRVVRFRPYRKGCGPQFKLTTWDTGRTAFGGKNVVGYMLSMGGGSNRTESATGQPAVWVVLFQGEDFGCSPMHAIDSDETIAGIMAFLTCRPGDTDPEYFANYTPEQLAYCSEHAESLSAEVEGRFGQG